MPINTDAPNNKLDDDTNPYHAPQSNLTQERASLASTPNPLATRMSRLGAVLIDAFIGIISSIPFWLASGLMDEITSGQSLSIGSIIGSIVYGLIAMFVIHGYLLNKYGQTIGKYLVKIYIADFGTAHKASLPTILFKRMLPISIVGSIPLIGGFLVLIDSLMIFRADHRCLHDLIARTQVLQIKK